MKKAEEFKGTKGIWEVIFIEFENYDILCVAREYTVISQQTFGGKATEEMKANAKLIAASPELLKVLIDMIDLFEGYAHLGEENQKAVDRAKQTINKALGL